VSAECDRCGWDLPYVDDCVVCDERGPFKRQLEEAQVLFTQYGNHHSSCILEHHAPGIRDCGCGYIVALRAVLGESE